MDIKVGDLIVSRGKKIYVGLVIESNEKSKWVVVLWADNCQQSLIAHRAIGGNLFEHIPGQTLTCNKQTNMK